MKRVGIVGNGPKGQLPTLLDYQEKMDFWIGADRGALYLAEQGITIDVALGDFDSVSENEYTIIEKHAKVFDKHPVMKNQTDLEIAIDMGIEKEASEFYFFGVTGGRMDHALMNIQLLYPLLQQGKRAVIIDKGNYMEMFEPGTYAVEPEGYFYISFLSFTSEVTGLTLTGFLYPLENQTIHWGSSLCISNELSQKKGTFSFCKGILILVKSFDAV
ncbi:thiamine diphosphokinase [Oceanobacillus neutriphilus]|uniref:Thiamine diphosphokinase n=1 Tax=Oceanobacillus neutriphilus TaxID=531815 RepID=A0ABQ2NWD7_9BACI|nr:thiamine diphosphokinase [Oceanobacillus neutriphilus]GGP12278.1 thiamine pyrophosphokinase [Oceanobacillus neutriphilus]